MSDHSVMTSSLRINFLKIGKLCDFSCDIDYSTKTNVFRDVFSLIINQSDPTRPKSASDGHFVPANLAAQASEARLYIYIYILSFNIKAVCMYLCKHLCAPVI